MQQGNLGTHLLQPHGNEQDGNGEQPQLHQSAEEPATLAPKTANGPSPVSRSIA